MSKSAIPFRSRSRITSSVKKTSLVIAAWQFDEYPMNIVLNSNVSVLPCTRALIGSTFQQLTRSSFIGNAKPLRKAFQSLHVMLCWIFVRMSFGTVGAWWAGTRWEFESVWTWEQVTERRSILEKNILLACMVSSWKEKRALRKTELKIKQQRINMETLNKFIK